MRRTIGVKTSTASKIPRLTPGEETKLSWAKRVLTFSEVPEEYRFFFTPLENADQPFPYTVTTPSYEGFLVRYPEKLVCLSENELILLQKNNPENVQRYSLDGFSCIEYSKVLLDSALHLRGIDQKGQPAYISMHFNTASDGVFEPVIQKVRQAHFSNSNELMKPPFAELEKENYKFASYSRNCLLPGEEVLQLIWEAELRESKFNFSLPGFLERIFFRTVFPNHVTLLTDQELIFIHENPEEKRKKKYGGYWEFMPIKKIEGLSIKINEKDLLCLSVNLTGGFVMENLYRPLKRTELEELVNKVMKRM